MKNKLIIKCCNSFPRHSKSRNVYEGNKRVTGLAFKSQGKDIFLFVVTENITVSINITSKDQQVSSLS